MNIYNEYLMPYREQYGIQTSPPMRLEILMLNLSHLNAVV